MRLAISKDTVAQSRNRIFIYFILTVMLFMPKKCQLEYVAQILWLKIYQIISIINL